MHATERTVAFRDLNPQAPTHVLVVPRDHFANAAELAAGDPQASAELLIHGGRGRHGRGARRLPDRFQHRRRGRAERVPHPPAPARRAPDDLASRVKRPTSRILLAVAAAALVVPFAAFLHGLRRRGPPGPGTPAPCSSRLSRPRSRPSSWPRPREGKLLPLRDGEQRMTPDHAGALHAVRTDGTGTDDYRCFLLDPRWPDARDRERRAARQPGRRPPRDPVPGRPRPGRRARRTTRTTGQGWTCFGGTGPAGVRRWTAPGWPPGRPAAGRRSGTGTGPFDAGRRVILQVHYNLRGAPSRTRPPCGSGWKPAPDLARCRRCCCRAGRAALPARTTGPLCDRTSRSTTSSGGSATTPAADTLLHLCGTETAPRTHELDPARSAAARCGAGRRRPHAPARPVTIRSTRTPADARTCSTSRSGTSTTRAPCR